MNNKKLKQIKNLIKPNDWDLGNDQLYKLCKDYPNHHKPDEIIAKIWIIGRTYSASIERRKNEKKKKLSSSDDFYIREVAPKIISENVDKLFASIKNHRNISVVNILHLLIVHKKLLVVFKKISKHNNRSLASKYLHFHFPELFFMYDSRAKSSLNKFSIDVDLCLRLIIKSNKNKIDNEYSNFFIKSFVTKKLIEDSLKHKINNRQFDKVLIGMANNNLRKRKRPVKL